VLSLEPGARNSQSKREAARSKAVDALACFILIEFSSSSFEIRASECLSLASALLTPRTAIAPFLLAMNPERSFVSLRAFA
jgi:hypothetical protein